MLWEDNYLAHHGIKGQKWGVRRYQNADGTLTKEGKRRYAALKSRGDVEKIFSSFSEKDKRLLDAGENDQQYMERDAHAYWVLKRFIAREGKTPVAFLDVIKGQNGEANIAVGTDSAYRGKGYASKVAARGSKWVDDHIDEFSKVNWGAFKENEPSINLAKKYGFILDNETESYATYSKKKREKR